jgi:hypothetical protein
MLALIFSLAVAQVPAPSAPPAPPLLEPAAPAPEKPPDVSWHRGEWGLELAGDFEASAVNGCCIFTDFGNGLFLRGYIASERFRFGVGVRGFSVISSAIHPLPLGVDAMLIAEYRLVLGRFWFGPSLALGGEYFTNGETALGVLIEPGLTFSFALTNNWSLHLRLDVSWTPMNQPIDGPLSYTRLAIGVDWWNPL